MCLQNSANILTSIVLFFKMINKQKLIHTKHWSHAYIRTDTTTIVESIPLQSVSLTLFIVSVYLACRHVIQLVCPRLYWYVPIGQSSHCVPSTNCPSSQQRDTASSDWSTQSDVWSHGAPITHCPSSHSHSPTWHCVSANIHNVFWSDNVLHTLKGKQLSSIQFNSNTLFTDSNPVYNLSYMGPSKHMNNTTCSQT